MNANICQCKYEHLKINSLEMQRLNVVCLHILGLLERD